MYKPAVDPPAAEEEFQVLRHAKDEMKKLKDELHEYKDKEKQVVTDDVVRFFSECCMHCHFSGQTGLITSLMALLQLQCHTDMTLLL